MKGHNYGLCKKCGKTHIHPRGMLGKKHPNPQFKKGHKTWNEGLTKETDERIKKYGKSISKNKERGENIGKAKLGEKRKPFSKKWRENLGKANKRNGKWVGEKNPTWRPDVLANSKRYDLKTNDWRKMSKELRKNSKCGLCSSQKNLVIHHIIPYRKTKDNSIKNLCVLCQSCHAKIHQTI